MLITDSEKDINMWTRFWENAMKSASPKAFSVRMLLPSFLVSVGTSAGLVVGLEGPATAFAFSFSFLRERRFSSGADAVELRCERDLLDMKCETWGRM